MTVGVTPATTQKPLPVGASGWKAGDCEHTGLFREARPMKLQRDVLDDRGLQWGSPLIQERNRDVGVAVLAGPQMYYSVDPIAPLPCSPYH